ncbi:unnamed protein product [Durusdinium trenchii]|uniref:Uncharacterized protein n=2 Tax=Durusdinium trenchii TaxID=1381693 RepID=A0ABP0N7N6_9DINO
MNHSLGSCIQPFGGCAPEASGARTPTRRMTRATGDERPEARRRDGRRADAFSARRMLLERILGEPDFAHYQSEGRHELVPVRQIKLVQEDPLAGTPVLIRWDFNNYTLVYGSLSQEAIEDLQPDTVQLRDPTKGSDW